MLRTKITRATDITKQSTIFNVQKQDRRVVDFSCKCGQLKFLKHFLAVLIASNSFEPNGQLQIIFWFCFRLIMKYSIWLHQMPYILLYIFERKNEILTHCCRKKSFDSFIHQSTSFFVLYGGIALLVRYWSSLWKITLVRRVLLFLSLKITCRDFYDKKSEQNSKTTCIYLENFIQSADWDWQYDN